MEVTRKNFKETMPLVRESIHKADFLVIDAEFTGLINGRDVSMFDSPQEYYITLLNGSTDFLLIQFGLCAFCWDDVKKQYLNESYNFYLFPRGRPGPEKIFLCQSSSLDFLAAQKFDFNKLIKEGISYMTEPTETRLRENLTERQSKLNNYTDYIPIPNENKSQIEGICKKVREFLDDPTLEEMDIDRCNAFIRRLLFQELGSRFKNEAFVESKVLENKDRVLKVTRLKSANDVKDLDSQKKEKEWEELEEAVGFSKIARMISQSEKLVIGHNMLLDVLHTLNHFFQPLPADYASFKEFTHCMFPRLLDTKYMSSLPPFKDKVNSSVLTHLFTTLSEPPFSVPIADAEEGRGYTHSDGKHHEAGYDAYVTGLCFLAMHSHISRMRGVDSDRVLSRDSIVLKPFINKLFLAKTAHQDSPYINLTGADATPSRDHVFHLTFPREWQRNDISELFSAFGQITVQFLDETTALVALSRKDLAKTVVRTFTSNTRISIVPYLKYKAFSNKCGGQHQVERREEVQEKIVKLYTENSPIARRGVRNTTPARSAEVSSPANSDSPAAQQAARKRTSSGVFQVEESEPPPKKTEVQEEDAEKKNHSEISNGRIKLSESKNGMEKDRRKQKEVKKRLDSDAPVKSVSAFKESDSWD